MSRMTLEQAKARFVHRFTAEHIPAWALEKRPDGAYCAPRGEAPWPFGKSLNKPFRK